MQNKIITTGEGGMVTTNDDELAARLRLLRNLAFTKPRFWHEEAGFNFRMTGYQAALGLAQLRRIDDILANKKRVARTYDRLLARVPGLQPAGAEGVGGERLLDVRRGRAAGIRHDARPAHGAARRGRHRNTYVLLSDERAAVPAAPAGLSAIECPVAEGLWRNGLYLPSSHTLTEEKIRIVTDAVSRAVRGAGEAA